MLHRITIKGLVEYDYCSSTIILANLEGQILDNSPPAEDDMILSKNAYGVWLTRIMRRKHYNSILTLLRK